MNNICPYLNICPRYNIYYAHHQWKYETDIEQYELDLIAKNFPNASIFNPRTGIKPAETEAEIMKQCLDKVMAADVIIFSSVDGCVGKGVYTEVKKAEDAGKLVLYIYKNRLHTNYELHKNYESDSTDRIYGFVELV